MIKNVDNFFREVLIRKSKLKTVERTLTITKNYKKNVMQVQLNNNKYPLRSIIDMFKQ